MQSSERRALLMLLGLAIAGHVVRRIATRPGEPPGQVELLSTLTPGSPAAHQDSAMRLARPLPPGERIDIDRASAQEIARLPRVGLALAKTIVADREANGAFGSLGALDRVVGLGPGLLKVIESHTAFSGTPRASQGGPGALPERPSTAAIGPSGIFAVNLNTAQASDLDRLPGVGPAKARAIVEHRARHGPFLSVDSLVHVPGFGPAALSRLRPLVTVH